MTNTSIIEDRPAIGALPGEGEVKRVERRRVRIECQNCGEPAVHRHTYLLPDARRNPASKGFGRDDISWCSDHDAFVCDECPKPSIEGMRWCSTFSITPNNKGFGHMFLCWIERAID
jgi:hypothetical protein